jgi:hypothetical protein
MALKVVGGNVTTEAYATNMSKSGAGGVIGKVNAGNYTKTGTIATAGSFRVDFQGSTGTHANLQVQVNGIKGDKSSIGGALVPLSLGKSIEKLTAAQDATKKARNVELTKAIQGALTQSVGTWKVATVNRQEQGEYKTFKVEGEFSS